MIKKLAISASALAFLAVGGCAEVDSVLGTSTTSLTPQQKVVLTAQVINGLCVLSAAGLAFAGGVNTIVHPNAATGGSGASATGTITKASAIDALSCQSLNGATATLIGTASGAATVQVAQ